MGKNRFKKSAWYKWNTEVWTSDFGILSWKSAWKKTETKNNFVNSQKKEENYENFDFGILHFVMKVVNSRFHELNELFFSVVFLSLEDWNSEKLI